jgi:hypothetical protein
VTVTVASIIALTFANGNPASWKRIKFDKIDFRTNAGRPNWDRMFSQLRDKNCGKITVFYCGNPQLAHTLREKCEDFGFDFRCQCYKALIPSLTFRRQNKLVRLSETSSFLLVAGKTQYVVS